MTDRGCACVPMLSTEDDRRAALHAAVLTETEPVITLTHLLRLCRDEHRLLVEQIGDSQHRLDAHLRPLLATLPPAGTSTSLDPAVRAALTRALEHRRGLAEVLVAYHLAQLLDETYGHGFASFFRRNSPYQPAVGDPVPLDSPDLPRITELAPTSPPWRLANRLDQTRHVRLAGEWAMDYRVVFDYTLFDVLAGVIGPDTVVATCHPNANLDELRVPSDWRARTFPVAPRDLVAQRHKLDQLIALATDAGASVVVLPELCVDETLAQHLRRWVEAPDGPRLLVAGTYHHEVCDATGLSRRVNTAVTWVRGWNGPLCTDKHSPAEHPIAEDIQPSGWPEIRVYVTADGWHLAVAVCRDLLNPQAVHALTEAGANLVVVPAMSDTLISFGGPAAQLVGTGQALVVVANNPAQWPVAGSSPTRPARGLFGHPGFGQQIRLVAAPDSGPGVALLAVRSGRLRWLPADELPSEPGTVTAAPVPARPAWARRLATAMQAKHAAIPSGVSVRLRSAAVLVVLCELPQGTHALLTRRAPDLADYPNLWVFPGGLVEPLDADVVAAALREATEEVGINGDAVDVLGVLHPLALPESGYVVTPVVCLGAPPSTVHINQAEVSELMLAPLETAALTPGVGAMTATVLEQLRGILTSVAVDAVDGQPASA